ncbi:MAG: hypothetical protein NT002_00955 [candidate division Zixibacteria bacterium]|nr:hypothetical protein [candidate division Zixibacteria bacterium]
MSKVTGKTDGVAKDVMDYLKAVAEYYGKEIKINSGKRTDMYSAEVVFNNWTSNVDRGQIYLTDTLSTANRTTLNNYYKTAEEDLRAKDPDKKKAKDDFLSLAASTIGKNRCILRGVQLILSSLIFWMIR